MSQNQDRKSFRTLFEENVVAIVAIVSVTVGVVTWVRGPINKMNRELTLLRKEVQYNSEQLETIQTNDIKHLEQVLNELEENDKKQSNKIERVETLVNQLSKQLEQTY